MIGEWNEPNRRSTSDYIWLGAVHRRLGPGGGSVQVQLPPLGCWTLQVDRCASGACMAVESETIGPVWREGLPWEGADYHTHADVDASVWRTVDCWRRDGNIYGEIMAEICFAWAAAMRTELSSSLSFFSELLLQAVNFILELWVSLFEIHTNSHNNIGFSKGNIKQHDLWNGKLQTTR